MSTSNAWFYSVNQQPTGPITYDQLLQLIANQTISRDTFLWYEGLPQWQPAHVLISPWPDNAPASSPAPSQFTAPPATAFDPYAAPAASQPDWAAHPPLYHEADFRSPFRRMVICFIIGLVLIFLGVIGVVVGAIAAENQRSSDFPVAIIPGLLVCLVAVAVLLAGLVFQMTLVYRYWNLIRDIKPDVTPGTAVGFLFIPLFNLYWVFRAFAHLSKEFNRYLRTRQIAAQPSSEGMSLTYCILTLISCIPYLGSLVGMVNLVFFFIMFIDFNRTAIAIANWQQTQVPQNPYPRRF